MTFTRGEDRKLTDLFFTYPDGYGCTVDWSGVSAVVACSWCGWQGGPWFSEAEARHEAGVHRQADHEGQYAREILQCRVKGCNTQGVSRGLCRPHHTRGKYLWKTWGTPYCAVSECSGKCIEASEWCDKHHNRYAKAARYRAQGIAMCVVQDCVNKAYHAGGKCGKHKDT